MAPGGGVCPGLWSKEWPRSDPSYCCCSPGLTSSNKEVLAQDKKVEQNIDCVSSDKISFSFLYNTNKSFLSEVNNFCRSKVDRSHYRDSADSEVFDHFSS